MHPEHAPDGVPGQCEVWQPARFRAKSRHRTLPRGQPGAMRAPVALLLALWLAVLARASADDVGVYDAEFEEPEVEQSELERHQFGTHTANSEQYDFVRPALAEREKEGDGQGGQWRQTRLPNGMKLVGMADFPLLPLMQAMFNKGPSADGDEDDDNDDGPPQILPPIEQGMPMSRVLQHIRQTLSEAKPPPSSRRAARDLGDGADGDGYIDHLSARGLQLLEADLRRKVTRARHTAPPLPALSPDPLPPYSSAAWNAPRHGS